MHKHCVIFSTCSTLGKTLAGMEWRVLVSLLLFAVFSYCVSATVVSHDGRAITIDGQRRVLLSGSIHYGRSTAEVNFVFLNFYMCIFNLRFFL